MRMTDEQAMDLGRRLVACEGFRWMPGMLARHSYTGPIRVTCDEDGENVADIIVRPGPDGNEVHHAYEWAVVGRWPDASAWPDLRDPATLGCVLELVRERWPDASPQRLMGYAVPPAWEVRTPQDTSFPGAYVCRSICEADTEAEALVAAMEAP